MPKMKSNGRPPTLEEQRSFFDSWNASWRSGGFDAIDSDLRTLALKVLDFLRSLRVSDPKIIEVGCGTGWLTEKLANSGTCTAIDLSEQAIAIAKQRGINADFIAGDFHTYQLMPDQFDVGVCVDTVSCVSDQQQFVQRLANVITPGGYVIITAVNKFVYSRRSDIRPPKPGNIRKWLSYSQLYALLSPHFRVTKTTTVLPNGDLGVLRLTNSSKINSLLSLFFTREAISRAKEFCGLGQYRIVLAQRRPLQPVTTRP